MGHYSTHVYSPVNQPDDLEPFLAVGRRADGFYHLEDYCRSPRVNKFSRYKPVAYPQMDPISEAQRESVAHGITLPTPVRSTSINGDSIIDACSLDWGYHQPTGGDSEPYRESDFVQGPNTSNGYYHYAVPPIQVVYPRDGWTFMRGSNQSRSLIIYVDLDPDDSAINLQSYDFVASGLNLNEWTLIAWVDSNYMNTKVFASDDTILNDGEISGNTIAINIPSGSGSWSCDVYICMYRYNNSISRYEFMPLPKQDDYNPEYYTLNVVDDAQQSGGGVPGTDTEEMSKNVSFASHLDGALDPDTHTFVYKTAWDCTDNGTAKWLLSGGGDLYVKMKLSNTSNSTSTINRGELQVNLEDTGFVSPHTMYDENKRSISSISIPSGGSVTIYLWYEALFQRMGARWDNTQSDPYNNSCFSMFFTRNGATLFDADIYAKKGEDKWIKRST